MSSSKKEEIKAAALTAAKGLSRAQAERAATAAARNVNAYGQKEEGPSRWQEKREAKRQMYLMSTEKAVKLGERKDVKPTMSTVDGNAQCQKCYQGGHWTFQCKNERVYISRPSRTQQLKNPKLRPDVSVGYDLDDNNNNNHRDRDVKEEKAKVSSKKSKRKYDSVSNSEDSVFETDSGSGSSSATGSDYSSSSGSSSSSESEEERRRKKKKSQKKKQTKKKSKGKSRRYSTSSESSDSDSGSDSDSDDKSSRRKKRHSRRR
ncbi:putative transcription factor interactor and regulator CCHC(Zn) family [Medicago truncatula]|uniref:Putative transcription factor interactor and regulator CCHC(Zn) family n=1 Tax=Medicago truncatula TaxID=3880 RepID=A0A396IFI3_MEDTR|nr:zinc finger CCHC domain-containing protein 10 [Medicago truncatula]RHN64356.1 putative transcription factor interactor and regulator CCHC(Zn) family [Medicago truncatula]